VAGKAGRWILKNTPLLAKNKMNPWFKNRELPDPPEQSFREWYRRNREKKQ
jgi:L-lactate dehydrogenase complex protein LldF